MHLHWALRKTFNFLSLLIICNFAIWFFRKSSINPTYKINIKVKEEQLNKNFWDRTASDVLLSLFKFQGFNVYSCQENGHN